MEFIAENFDNKEIVFTEKIRFKWRKILNLISEISNVYAVLFMQNIGNNAKIISANDNLNELYVDQMLLETKKTLSFNIFKTNQNFFIENTRKYGKSKPNFDIENGIISFFGLPIKNIDGSNFGAICILDKKENNFNKTTRDLLEQFQQVIEADVKIYFEKIKQESNQSEDFFHFNKENSKLALALEQSENAIVITDEAGNIEFVNNYFCKITGYSKQEVIGERHNILKSGEHDEAFYSSLWKTIKAGNKWEGEFYNKKKTGEFYWEKATITPIKDASGKIINFIGVKVDITEVKASEKRLKTLINASPSPIFFKDGNGRWLEVNEAGLKLFELQNFDYRGKKDIEIADNAGFYKDALLFCEKTDQETWERGELGYYEEVLPTKEGGAKIFDTIKIPIFNNNKSRDGLVIIGREITDAKKEEVIQLAQLKLVEYSLNSTIDDLLQKFIDEAEKLTESQIGFYHFFEEDEQTIFLQAWSSNTANNMCEIAEIGTHYPISEAGVWIDAIKQRKPIIHNDYNNLKHKKGLPDGHAPIFRDLVVPVFRGDKIVAVLGVGNKKYFYNETDVSTIQKLADLAWQTVTRRQAELSLRESEEKFRYYIKHAPTGIFVSDAKGYYVDANEAATNITGYSNDELLRLNFADLIFSEDLENAKQHFENLANSGNSSGDFRFVHKSGKVKYWNVSAVKVTDNQFIAFVLDITELKEAEQTIIENNETLNTILNSFDQGVYLCNADYQITYLNQGMIKKIGRNAVGEKCYKTIYNNDEKCSWCYFDKLKETKTKTNIEVELNGEFYIVTSVLLKDDVKLTVYHDITKLKKSEIELKISQKRFEQLSNLTFEGILIHENGLAIDVNLSFAKMIGYSQNELIGKNLISLLIPEEFHEIIKKHISSKHALPYIVKAKKRDGSLIDIEIESKDIILKNNQKVRVSAIRNVTERLKTEQKVERQKNEYAALNEEYKTQNEELYKAKENAEQSNKLKTEFLHNMSHEIRTPLNAILGFSELLDDPRIQKSQKNEYVNIIKNSGRQLLTVIDDILEVSKLETKKSVILNREFFLNELLDELFYFYQIKAKEKKIDFSLHKTLDNNKSLIISDEKKINKIIRSLLDNALKYTVQGSVGFGYEIKNDFIEFFVKDTGIGISNDKHEIVFERFIQEELELTRKYGGLGLGLAIVKENVQLLNGSVHLYSDKGKGSTFIVSIPYFTSENKDQLKGFNKLSNDFKILIAEDEEVNFLYLKELIDSLLKNVEILYAKDGEQALKMAFENDNISLIFMDLKMPMLDGYEASRKIKKVLPDLPIIAQTAYSTTQDEAKAYQYGCDDFISKPLEKNRIKILLAKYLNIII
ncbi:MAG: PAS domain S-box protein [Bacteroidales bacterium]|nr:PAS domain S-box protein [Bacteroidales bacterium]